MKRVHIIIDNKNPDIQPAIDKLLEKLKAKKIGELEYIFPKGSFEDRMTIYNKFQNLRKGRRGYRFVTFVPKTRYFGVFPPSWVRCKRLYRNSDPIDFYQVLEIL